MRDAFFRALTAAGRDDPRVWALTGDLGVGLFDEFARVAPGRFLNVGIAEQTLVGAAAGLAYAGRTAVAYSIAPFLYSRAHDQVRVDVALADANVKLVGVGGGVSYGHLGPTHHAIDDLAALRALPNMTILTPGDPAEAEVATHAALAHRGPVYLRLGKNGEPSVLPAGHRLAIGRAAWLRPGADVTIASVGTMLPTALAAATELERRGVDAGVLHYGTLKPFDAGALDAALARTPVVVTVEEHSVLGGFGGAVAEAMAESGRPGLLTRVGLADTFAHAVGSREHLLARYGCAPLGVVEAARRGLARCRAVRAA